MCLSTSVPRHHYFRNTSPWQLYIAIDVVGSSVSVYVYVSLCIPVSVDISFSLSFDCRLSLTLETNGLHCQRLSTNYLLPLCAIAILFTFTLCCFSSYSFALLILKQ